ncbi:hypothetical protein BDF22DRAFT_701739 [Syncephalis plumigaleata]|nr:hypothetical protein BDF22DRAFT_701739 [Syncephalis plumigaleata]
MSTGQLAPKVVLITGCSAGGIGASLASEFAERGCTVYATARRLEAMSELEPLGIHTLHILVNNAGISRMGPIIEQDIPSARSVFDTNVWGVLAMTQLVVPHMMKRRSGLVVNIGSIAGICATVGFGCYCPSKAAVHSMTDILRMELTPYNVDVTLVLGGLIKSNIITAGVQDSRAHAISASEFSKQVVSKVLRKSPPRNIYSGGETTGAWLLSLLPRWLQDYLFTRRFDLLNP